MTAGKSAVAVLLSLLGGLIFCMDAGAWTNGQDAVAVIGQPDFTSSGSGAGTTGLHAPYDVALDTVHGKLYVADGANHRVLRYAYPLTGNQPNAELVFGQPDFLGGTAGTSQNTFNNIRGLAVDGTGRLWVSEFTNNRVVWFNSAYAIATNQPYASGVLGQKDFISGGAATTQNGMRSPYGLTVDATGRIYVADAGNNRVLRFDNAADKANGTNADGVLGQPDFTSNTAALTQNGMNTPRGVAVYGASLFVAERNAARVLRFDNAAGRVNGANADGVLGQADFISNVQSLSQGGMEYPGRLAADGSGRLYVSDGFNFDRVVIFHNAANRPNGANADFVLGQPDFVSAGAGLAQNRISLDSSAGGMAVDDLNHILILADFGNNRVLLYQDPSPPVIYISGNAGAPGVVLSYNDGGQKTTMADGNGNYSLSVPFNWSGTINPSLGGYTFLPPARTYANVTSDRAAQNFIAVAASPFQVPAVSEWGMILFAVFSGAGAVHFLRRKATEI